jgi:mycofactocin precursor
MADETDVAQRAEQDTGSDEADVVIEDVVLEDLLVEEISIDGMCGVY